MYEYLSAQYYIETEVILTDVNLPPMECENPNRKCDCSLKSISLFGYYNWHFMD